MKKILFTSVLKSQFILVLSKFKGDDFKDFFTRKKENTISLVSSIVFILLLQGFSVGNTSNGSMHESYKEEKTNAAAGCYIFTHSSDGISANNRCGTFVQTLNIEIVALEDLTVSGDQTIACGDTPTNLTATTTGTILSWESNTIGCGADDDWAPIAESAGMGNSNPGTVLETTYCRAVIGGAASNCMTGNCELVSDCVTITTPDDFPV